MEQGPLGHRPSWQPIDPAQVSKFLVSCRPIYTFCFRLRCQSLWDISQPPFPHLPFPRCYLCASEKQQTASSYSAAQLGNPLPVSSLRSADFSPPMYGDRGVFYKKSLPWSRISGRIVVTDRRTWLDVSTCDSPSKLVCPNVSFVVVTESILFRIVNLCRS